MKQRIFLVILFFLTVTNFNASDAETYILEPTTGTTLSVKTDIPNAEVYLNGILMGKTPLMTSVQPGIWRLSLLLNGYYQEQRTVRIEPEKETKVDLTLTRITGILRIENVPNGSLITISEKEYNNSGTTTLIELPEGKHTVKIRAFGYTDINTDIAIKRKEETILDSILEPASFSLSNFRTTKKSFNPANPGNLGLVQFRFKVTATGSASLILYSPDGIEFPLENWNSFNGWDQEAKWNGKISNGTTAVDGIWTAILSASDGTILKSSVIVDTQIRYPQAGFSSAASSAGSVASATIMPPQSGLILFNFGIESSAPIPGITLSAGWNPGKNWLIETGVKASVYAGNSGSRPVNVGLSIKTGYASKTLAGATYIRALFTTGADTLPTKHLQAQEGSFIRNGLSLGAVGELRKGPLSANLDISLTNGNRSGNPVTGPLTTAGGLSLTGQAGVFSGGLWIRGESGSIDKNPDNFIQESSFATGVSTRLIIPGTNLIIIGEAGRIFGAIQKTTGTVSFGMLF